MPKRTRRACLPVVVAVVLLIGAARSAFAKAEVTIDAASLNELMSAMAVSQVRVPLTEGRGVTLKLHDFRVTGFDPTEGEKQEGFVLTSLRLEVPELGLNLPLTPRLSLQTGEKNGKRIAYLKFERVSVPLPITGAVDVAPLLPVLPLPTDTSWTVAADSGNVRVRTILTEARMGAKNLRLSFDLEATKTP
jgi:hypothetical protein